MESEVHALQIAMTEITANLKNFGNKLEEHIANQKETDKKVDDNFSKIFTKIDHLGDTFQTRLGDKADQKEVMETLDKSNIRVSTLERWQSYVLGFCACVALLLVPLVISVLINYFN